MQLRNVFFFMGFWVVMLIFATLLASCGYQEQRSPRRNEWDGFSNNYSYEFVTGSCTTGWHTFMSKASYCSALTNDSLNNNCAKQSRAATHQQRCTRF